MEKKDNWKIWKKSSSYGDLYYKRATGELGEMESAKAFCKVITPFYSPGMRVLDVGCGAGHYLKSLWARVDREINYTGLDATESHVEMAKKVFGPDQKFLKGDIFNLPFENNAFDMVMCNNVILHLPPPPAKAFSELIRVAKKYVVIRTVFGERNYQIKEIRGLNEKINYFPEKFGDILDEDGEPFSFNFFNMYTEQYIKEIVSKIDANIKVKIIRDSEWQPFDNREVGGSTATRVIDGKQISGNLILDWKFIILEKN